MSTLVFNTLLFKLFSIHNEKYRIQRSFFYQNCYKIKYIARVGIYISYPAIKILIFVMNVNGFTVFEKFGEYVG